MTAAPHSVPDRAPARRIAAICLVLAIVTVLLVPEAFPVLAQVVSAVGAIIIIARLLLITFLEPRP